MAEKSVSEMSEAEYQAAKKDRLRAPKEEKPVMKLSHEEYKKARQALSGKP